QARGGVAIIPAGVWWQALRRLRLSLPQHVVAELFRFGAHLSQRAELGLEDLVGVRALVFVVRTPVCDDGHMVVGAARRRERAFVGNETRKREYLAGDEAALVAAVGILDDVAHLTQRKLDVLHRGARLELHGVEQHLCPEGNGDRPEHASLRRWDRALLRSPPGGASPEASLAVHGRSIAQSKLSELY